MVSISSSKSLSPVNWSRKDYAYITMSADQTTDIANTNPIKFNLISGNMYLDAVNYRVTLKANKTYRMQVGVLAGFSGNTGAVSFNIYNVTDAAQVGTRGYCLTADSATHTQPTALAFYEITTTVDTIFDIRLNSPTALSKIYAAYSFLEIQELETFSPMVQTYQYAYVSPKLILSVSSTQTGFVLTRATGVFYKLSDGSWILDFSISFNITAATSTTLTIAGILTDNLGGYQCGSAYSGGGNWQWRADSNTNNLTTNGTNSSSVHCSGFLYLSTKPTGYALPSDV